MENNSPITEIYTRYAKTVKVYILSLCKDSDLADDITAEAFLKAIKNIDSFKDGNILTWLCTIAKNTYFDYARKKERQNIPLSDELSKKTADTASTPEETAVAHESKLSLYQTLQLLESDAREVLYLRMFTDLSFNEIGSILNKSENWARVVFYRAKTKLKGLMKNEE